ncbi:hypothetical protein DOZ58_06775 [Acetobacterium sp. KB-1]|jgi:hypothetical protein|nr:hypothetical protein DOZ58_06775 [Acetobacterium sp. KB-1]
MLFSNPYEKKYKESYKERNLYYKIFAGVIFNELIPENDLPLRFIECLSVKYGETCEAFKTNEKTHVIADLKGLKEDAQNGNLTVFFDYHIEQILKEKGLSCYECSMKGEIADIFIGGSNNFIAIEAKYLTDFGFGKDVEKNQKRILFAQENIGTSTGIQVLLISDKKHYNLKKKKNCKNSNYEALRNYLVNQANDIPFILIDWKDIENLIPDNISFGNAKKYLEKKLRG